MNAPHRVKGRRINGIISTFAGHPADSFIGIGGSGMCSLAEILHTLGYEVSGSDDMESDNVSRLRALGIPVALPLAAENIRNPEAVVYTVAICESHPEMQAARALGVPIIERAALLGMLTRHYPRSLAVSGTHGKTTTTSMISQILLEAEFDPTLRDWRGASPLLRRMVERATPTFWSVRPANSRITF